MGKKNFWGKLVKVSEMKNSRLFEDEDIGYNPNTYHTNESFARFSKTEKKSDRNDPNMSFRVRKPSSKASNNSKSNHFLEF